eukprot:CAMPEP_0206141198 /NCGR_PEP_ID=MMETSP1473-20131121/12087_1 /ASSEMBLY_ACC=CAM_ASM_001109 /TAXON_ID=1461547 /ORGANISM="Stichococcus sp, Strain RCC1054" /LENGTH=369 /DNA_ID=CAMNT_0053535663 /DNA_START=229 /DNA_END=1338 /DNA_ORIENTATION=+
MQQDNGVADMDHNAAEARTHARKSGNQQATTGQPAPAQPEPLPVMMYSPTVLPSSRFAPNQAVGKKLEVRIAPQWMTNTNQQVRARQLWGSDIYTEDSDLVAALMHAGFYSISLPAAPPSVAEVRAVVALLPPEQHYPSASRHSIRSRAWGASLQGCSFKVERAWLVTAKGETVELEAGAEGAPAVAATFSPAAPNHSITTRAAASSVERRQRNMQEVTVQYNLCNEPWTKYSMATVADRGLKPAQWTSARLHHQVLYLETHRQRYELSRVPTPAGGEPNERDVYRWARCPPLSAAAMRAAGTPLPAAQVQDAVTGLAWEDFQWGPTGVHVDGSKGSGSDGKDHFYTLARAHFVSCREPADSSAAAGSK